MQEKHGKNFDFDLGFDVYKLSKADAEKVGNLLAERISKNLGPR